MNSRSLFMAALVLGGMSASAQVSVDIDVAQRKAQVSPHLYGLFFEDINHAADGGLYAELIRNRSFEDSEAVAANWSAVGKAALSLSRTKLLNGAQRQALQVNFTAPGDGFSNEGYWGIHAVQGRTYKLSFWAKGKLNGKLKAMLTDATGKQIYASAAIGQSLTGKWTKYTATLVSNGNDAQARFVLVSDGTGTATFDVVSLFPPTFKNRENGLRPDLARLLYNAHPKFMRFPGGCFVEGQKSPDNAFHWERTVGPIEERPGHMNENWGYRTTDGLGYHEFLQLSEDLGSKPLYVVNIGLWHGGKTPVDSIQPWIDECMQALEYANGPVTSKYGAMRARNGHPAPFNIEYLEIGNENNQPDPNAQSDRYYERFKKFKDAVLAVYPHMHLIGNVVAWGDDNPKWESDEAVELLDEHYYRSPAWFANNFNKYDSYSRKGAGIYVGEYAVTQGFGKVGSLNAALGEAVYMMGMENNSDVVKMASYAPIFVNENNVAWQPDMIRFNASQVMCTPSYYVQQLMARNVGTQVLAVQQHNPYADRLQQQTVAPALSKWGFATWDTQASFRFKSLEGADGKALQKMETVSGNWTESDGTYMQTANQPSCLMVNATAVPSRDYTLKLRARKDSGAEGFMVVFNYVDADNYSWINFGGWGNTQHGIEQVIDGSKMQTVTTPGHIDTGKWYDITLRQHGDSLQCWLDGEQVFNARLMQTTVMGVFSSATYDEVTGDVIVKVANTGNEDTTARINLKNYAAREAQVIRLTSAKGTDENTMDNPTRVYPVEETCPVTESTSIDVPAYSLNIVRIKK